MRARITAKKAAAAPKLTPEQRLLLEQLRGKGYEAVPEVRFHPTRKWRVDVVATNTETANRYARSVAIEIDGGVWSRGRHTRGAGFMADLEKMNALTEAGWRVLRFTPQQVRSGAALAQIERCL